MNLLANKPLSVVQQISLWLGWWDLSKETRISFWLNAQLKLKGPGFPKSKWRTWRPPTPGTSSGHRVGLSENTRGWIMLSFFSRIWPFVTLWTVAYQAPLYMGVGLDPSIFEYASLPGKVFCETPQHFCDFMQTKTTWSWIEFKQRKLQTKFLLKFSPLSADIFNFHFPASARFAIETWMFSLNSSQWTLDWRGTL